MPDLQAKLGDTLIAMDAPPERENVPAFVHVQGLLLEAGVSVPAIVARDVEQASCCCPTWAPPPTCRA